MLDEGSSSSSDNLETPEAPPPPEESNNRTFLIVGGIFAALIFLTLVCGAIYVLYLGPRLSAQRNAAQQTVAANNAQVVQQMTSTAQAALATPTLEPSDTPTNTPLPQATPQVTPTPLFAQATVAPLASPTTNQGTLAALQTQLAQQMTLTAGPLGTPGFVATGAMPRTGFFDQVVPGLVVLTLALIGVIFLARRLRKAPTK